MRECYGKVEGEYLAEKVKGIERYAVQNTKKSWDLVNEVTQRKKTNSGLIDGGSATERLKSWVAPVAITDNNLLDRVTAKQSERLLTALDHVYTDASPVGLGASLLQEGKAV